MQNQKRDSVAVIEFVTKLEREVKEGKKWDELTAAAELVRLRRSATTPTRRRLHTSVRVRVVQNTLTRQPDCRLGTEKLNWGALGCQRKTKCGA